MLGLFAFWLLWVFFLAVMELRAARDAGLINRQADCYYLALSVLFVGYIIDFLVNVFVASVIFLEPPFEMTVTARVTRWKKDEGIRGKIARWICAKLLDPFQVGGHCR